jgi:hypothetical protein
VTRTHTPVQPSQQVTGARSSNGHRPIAAGTLPTRQHPKGYAALAVALIVGFAALGFWFYSQAGAKVPVVMAVNDIPSGHVITREDVTTVQVAGRVTAVGANHLDSLIGQTATVEILPNTLVQRAMVTASTSVPASQAIVGVALAPGQSPSAGLRPGDRVDVLGLPAKGVGQGAGTGTVLAAAVTVFDVRDNPSTAGGLLASLIVPKQAATTIAAASNADLVALVKVGG